MKDLYIKRRALSEDTLLDLIDEIPDFKTQQARVTRQNENILDTSSRSTLVSSMKIPEWANIYSELLPMAKEFYPDESMKIKELQYLHYSPGDHFKKHNDQIKRGDKKDWRVLTSVTLLSESDDLIGGDLVLFRSKEDKEFIDPKLEVGESIMFSAETFHQVIPVEKGTRESLITWFYLK